MRCSADDDGWMGQGWRALFVTITCDIHFPWYGFYGSMGLPPFCGHLFWYDVTVLLPRWLALAGSGRVWSWSWSGLVWSGLVFSYRNVFFFGVCLSAFKLQIPLSIMILQLLSLFLNISPGCQRSDILACVRRVRLPDCARVACRRQTGPGVSITITVPLSLFTQELLQIRHTTTISQHGTIWDC